VAVVEAVLLVTVVIGVAECCEFHVNGQYAPAC